MSIYLPNIRNNLYEKSFEKAKTRMLFVLSLFHIKGFENKAIEELEKKKD